MSTNQDLSALSSGRYSFIHKVIDGMTITVNAVLVTFKSPVFVASVQVNSLKTLILLDRILTVICAGFQNCS